MRILFVSANPDSSPRLPLDVEIRDLRDELSAAQFRSRIRLVESSATTTDHLVRAIRRHKPEIVHFSGHGSTQGLVFHRDGDAEAEVAREPLRRFFHGRDVRLVVLNACCSQSQGSALVGVVSAVVGTTQEVEDEAARKFTIAFYRAIGDGLTIEQAFKDATDAVNLAGLEDVFWMDGEVRQSFFDPTSISRRTKKRWQLLVKWGAFSLSLSMGVYVLLAASIGFNLFGRPQLSVDDLQASVSKWEDAVKLDQEFASQFVFFQLKASDTASGPVVIAQYQTQQHGLDAIKLARATIEAHRPDAMQGLELRVMAE